MTKTSRIDADPFHRGERAIQERVGVREKMAQFGQRVIRDHLPHQHRAFFKNLPYLFYGALDERGSPWASLLIGEPGFVAMPNDRTLALKARPLAGDPTFSALRSGSDVGILGIDLDTRRRNRVNGRVTSTSDQGFALRVAQSFGNCPKYIQRRSPDLQGAESEGTGNQHAHVTTTSHFTSQQRRFVDAADTFFIATQFSENANAAIGGVDVSHRGGKPGFVRVEENATLIWPDFSGNKHFNTLGNLQLNPRAGLLFLDFEKGDLLYMTGTAEIVWDGSKVDAFEGAERLVRFQATHVIHAERALPFSWSFEELSPFL